MKSQRTAGDFYRPGALARAAMSAGPIGAPLPAAAPADFVASTGARPQNASALARTGLALLSAQTVTWLTSLIGILVIPRYLGSSGLGVWAVANTIAVFLTAVCAFGTSSHIVKLIARDPVHSHRVVAHALVLRSLLWLLVMGGPIAALYLAGVARDDLPLIAVLFVSALLATWADAVTAGLQGLYRMGRAQVGVALALLLSQVVTVITLAIGGRVMALAWIALANSLAGVLILAYLFFRNARPSWRLRPTLVRELAWGGTPFLAWTLAQLTYGTIQTLILAALASSAATGEFTFAWRLATIPVFVGTIVTQTTFPALAESAHADRAYFGRLLTHGLRLTIICVVPMAVGLAVIASYIAPVIGGDSYGHSAPVIQWLSAMIALACMGTVLGTGLMSLDKQRPWAIAGWCAAGLNIALNLALIPLADRFTATAANGTAVSSVVTEVFMLAVAWKMVGWNLDRRAVAQTMARTLVACGIMAIACVVAYVEVHPLAAIPAGMVVYPIAAVLTGAVSRSELRRFHRDIRPGSSAPAQAMREVSA